MISHLPSIGDVVYYRNKNMVVIDISNNAGYSIYYLLPEVDINQSLFAETLKLIRKAASVIYDYDSNPEDLPFTLICSGKYIINSVSYTSIKES